MTVFLLLAFLLISPLTSYGIEVIEIDQTAPVLSYVQKSESIESEKPFEISAQVTDNQKVARVVLFYRRNGEGEFQSAEMVNTDHDHFAYVIPGEEIHGERLEYYLVAEDEAGNRTMRGFSGTPLIFKIVSGGSNLSKKPKVYSSSYSMAHPDLFRLSDSKNGLELYLGENTYRLYDQGYQIMVPALTYGIEGQFQYQPDREIDVGINSSHTDAININWVVYQNLSGTLYESLDTVTVYAGQRFRQKYTSLLLALSYMNARINDRNLLNGSGFRITRFPDESYSQTGVTLGLEWHYPVTPYFTVGFDPKLNLFFSGQLDFVTLPLAVRYVY